jgi:hypothetical protein
MKDDARDPESDQATLICGRSMFCISLVPGQAKALSGRAAVDEFSEREVLLQYISSWPGHYPNERFRTVFPFVIIRT